LTPKPSPPPAPPSPSPRPLAQQSVISAGPGVALEACSEARPAVVCGRASGRSGVSCRRVSCRGLCGLVSPLVSRVSCLVVALSLPFLSFLSPCPSCRCSLLALSSPLSFSSAARLASPSTDAVTCGRTMQAQTLEAGRYIMICGGKRDEDNATVPHTYIYDRLSGHWEQGLH